MWYLRAVVIISVLTLDSRESKVTLHSTYTKFKTVNINIF